MKDLTALIHRRIFHRQYAIFQTQESLQSKLLVSHLGENHAKNDQ